VWAVVVAAGAGTRLGGTPKQFRVVGGRPMVQWSLDVAVASAHGVVVVIPPDGDVSSGAPSSAASDIASLVPPGVDVVTGAPTRSGSVRAGLAALEGRAADDDIVVIHDAARPLATPALFSAVADAVRNGADAAVPGVPVVDTVKRVVDGWVVQTLDRDELMVVQTPQAFAMGVLRRAHLGEPEATDDAGLVEAAGGTVAVVPGEVANRKVTLIDDLVDVEQALLQREIP
jgi:2-C-methyl-D-erythritol 4-phosphate cytidylyltransferase